MVLRRIERRLAAIVAADVAGYSRLMGLDEVGTAYRLREHQAAVAPLVIEHGGRIVKITGDAMLLEFPSAVAAVDCAVAVQHLLDDRNRGVQQDSHMLFRIGINVGDVLISDGDILGDGVNIAARIENIAPPGGVYVSRTAYEQCKGKVAAEFVDLGEQQFRNIAEPIRVYAVVPRAGAALPTARPDMPRPGSVPRLSIVVLPFVNLSADSEQDYFVDGITETLTTDLSRIDGMFVIARNTAFTYKDKAIDAKQLGRDLGVRYVLEGSVQHDGTRLRVNIQLVDADSGAHLWAERFDRAAGDLFEMQDEIVTRVARALDVELATAEARRAGRSRSADRDALDLFFCGWAVFNRGQSPEDLLRAEQLFERALATEADNVRALVGLAAVKFAFAATYATDERVAHLTAAEAAVTKALTLAPNDARAHCVLGWIYTASNRPALGIAESQRAIVLDRNMAPSYACIGWAKPMLGRAEETEDHIARAFRLSPRDPLGYVWCYIAGVAKLSLGCDEEAVAWLQRSIETNQNYPIARFTLAAALAHAGKVDDARATAAAGLARVPTFSIRRYREGASTENPTYLAYRERICEGLRKAGVPEDNDGYAQGVAAAPSSDATAPRSRSALSQQDFIAALKGALRDFSRPDLLAKNPLLRSRLLISRGRVGPADLQNLLSETVATLFVSPRDETLRRVIELTYFRPAPKQEAAAERLGLAFSTYRRHLTTGLRRLGAWLWDREQGVPP
jgi:TolB-like protein/class 3 adenylate cyclase